MITLTNGVQVPENAVQLQTTAAIDGYYVTQPLRLVQYDETLPVAAVQLTYQNQPYIPPTGAELNVRMGKPDGTTVYNPCLGMDSSGIVYFAFTQQMTIVAGTGTLTVEITDSGVKNSAPIIAEIRPNPVPEDSIESADEFLTLQEILAEAEKWGQIVQTNAANIQQVVDNLADIQNAAENAQAAAESAAAAQQAAQEALGFRTFFSAVRPDSNGNLDPSRPMTVGPAASLTIESAGDRIQSVTAHGFTQQAGTGDPSPTNVRQLTNGGLKLVAVTFDGSGDEGWQIDSGATTGASGSKVFHTNLSFHVPDTATSANAGVAFFGYLKNVRQANVYSGSAGDDVACVVESGTAHIGRVFIRIAGISTVPALQTYLTQNPILAWIQPADESEATGLYAPIILTSGEYRATCLELTAPLCEGDSVVSWVKSGCDKVVTYDGSEDEKWTLDVTPGSGPADSKRMYIRLGVNVPNNSQSEAGVLLASYLRNTATANVLLGDASINTIAVQQSTVAETGTIYLRIDRISTVEALREYLAAHPLTVWYRSTNYTESADIPVSLETHARSVFEFNQNTWLYAIASGKFQFGTNNLMALGQNAKVSYYSGLSCEAYKPFYAGSWSALGDFQIARFENQNRVYDSRFETAEEFEQRVTDNPVKLEYELATPLVYAHPAVVLEAATGDQLTYTVTGQSGGTVSVALKPFQDGGHAATADNATNAQNAGNAQTATDSQRLAGLSLSELQNLLVPVGYIFSWAPTSGGPDLSTPAKVAAYFGFGTWQAYGTGQVLVGVDSSQTEFATVGKTGGEKTHTLTVNEIPAHNHETNISNTAGENYLPLSTNVAANVSAQIVTTNTGGGQAHNNLQPYITVYRWQRVA